jgi:hypothetical protein
LRLATRDELLWKGRLTVFGGLAAMVAFTALGLLVGGPMTLGLIATGIVVGPLISRAGFRKIELGKSTPKRIGDGAPALRGPQMAGRRCVECKKKIVFEGEGVPCTECVEALHADCATRHLASVHSSTGPFR